MVFGELVSWSADRLNGTGASVDEWMANQMKNLEDVWGTQITGLHTKGFQDRTEDRPSLSFIGVSYKAVPI